MGLWKKDMNDQQVEKDELLALVNTKYKEALRKEGENYKKAEYYKNKAEWFEDVQTVLSFVVAVSSGATVIAVPAWLPFISSIALTGLNEYIRRWRFNSLANLHTHLGMLYSELLDFLDEQKILNLDGNHHVYIEEGEAKKIQDFEDYRVYLVSQIDKRVKVIQEFEEPPEDGEQGNKTV